jgi:hypothetical protein
MVNFVFSKFPRTWASRTLTWSVQQTNPHFPQVKVVIFMKNPVFWIITPCGSCKNDDSEERIASIIRVTRIGELGTTLAVQQLAVSSIV